MMLRRTAQGPVEAPTGPGFAWWYLDVADDAGNGLVLIWSWGLPFLPGRGPARERPSLNLAVYAAGRPVFHHLAALAPDDAHQTGGVFRFGRSTITTGGRDAWSLEADLDGDVPGGRFTGTIRASGVPFAPGDGGGGDHTWTPVATGRAEVSLRCEAGGTPFEARFAGRAYHDRNACPRPLAALGIERWLWGRVDDLVFYRLIGVDGRVEDHVLHAGRPVDWPIRAEGFAWSVYGRTWPSRLHVGDRVVHLDEAVDESPFYARLIARTAERRGFAEVVWPGHLDRPWQRPFVEMAVQRPAGNSPWLPLFAGPRAGRWGRLVRWWADA